MIPLFEDIEEANRDDEERYVSRFLGIKLNTGFYFSYSYDLTHSL